MIAVYIKCKQYHKSVLIDTNIRIFEEDWDYENGIVVNRKHSKQLNLLIRKFILKLEEFEFSFENGVNIHKTIK